MLFRSLIHDPQHISEWHLPHIPWLSCLLLPLRGFQALYRVLPHPPSHRLLQFSATRLLPVRRSDRKFFPVPVLLFVQVRLLSFLFFVTQQLLLCTLPHASLLHPLFYQPIPLLIKHVFRISAARIFVPWFPSQVHFKVQHFVSLLLSVLIQEKLLIKRHLFFVQWMLLTSRL